VTIATSRQRVDGRRQLHAEHRNCKTLASVANLKDYAKARGLSVPSGVPECEVLLTKAMDAMMEGSAFLHGRQYLCERTTTRQALPFPRAGLVINCRPVGAYEVPVEAIKLQCLLAVEAQDVDLEPTVQANASGPVLEKTVDVITTVYANPGNVSRIPTVSKADALLRVLVRRSGLFVTRA
jgi:hypothetical protein